MTDDWAGDDELSGAPAAYVGRSVTLRAVSRDDYALFLRWKTDIRELHLWSTARRIPTVEEFASEMDQLLGKSITFLALNKASGQPIGFVQAYNVNPKDGWCFFLTYFAPQYHGSSPEACLVFLDYLFRNFSLRKIYLESYDFNRDLLGSAIESACVEEGRLRQHTWYDDRYWDMVRLAVYRETWPDLRERASLLLGVGQEASELRAEQEARKDASSEAGS